MDSSQRRKFRELSINTKMHYFTHIKIRATVRTIWHLPGWQRSKCQITPRPHSWHERKPWCHQTLELGVKMGTCSQAGWNTIGRATGTHSSDPQLTSRCESTAALTGMCSPVLRRETLERPERPAVGICACHST